MCRSAARERRPAVASPSPSASTTVRPRAFASPLIHAAFRAADESDRLCSDSEVPRATRQKQALTQMRGAGSNGEQRLLSDDRAGLLLYDGARPDGSSRSAGCLTAGQCGRDSLDFAFGGRDEIRAWFGDRSHGRCVRIDRKQTARRRRGRHCGGRIGQRRSRRF
jgi:hypothetical protein